MDFTKIRPILVKYCFFQIQLGNRKYQIFFWAGINVLSHFNLHILSLEGVEVLAQGIWNACLLKKMPALPKPELSEECLWMGVHRRTASSLLKLFEIYKLKKISELLLPCQQTWKSTGGLKPWSSWERQTFCSICTYKMPIWNMLKMRGFNHSTSNWLVPSKVPSLSYIIRLLLTPKDYCFLCIFHKFVALKTINTCLYSSRYFSYPFS